MMPAPRLRYTAEDARLLVSALRFDVPQREVTAVGSIGEPIGCRVRYCCAAVGLEVIAARAAADDPRCPCARREAVAL